MAKIKTQLTTLAYADGASPQVYATLVNVTSISGPTSERGEIDTTDLSSTARENISALIDHGTIDVSLMWDERDTTHAAVRALFDADTERFQSRARERAFRFLSWG